MEDKHIQAVVLAAGDPEQFGGFFSAGSDFLGKYLLQSGINARYGEILNGDAAGCMEILRSSSANSDIIIILAAPTAHTAATVASLLAKGLGLTLRQSDEARQCVRQHATQVAVPPTAVEEQAFCTIPDGATVLRNPAGFLQGYVITASHQLLLVLPAAPSELKGCYDSYVGTLLERFAQSRVKAVAHAAAAPRAVQSSAIAAPQPAVHATVQTIPKSQAESVQQVCNALTDSGLTVATAESGTRGALAQALGSYPSDCFDPNNGFWGSEALNSLGVDSGLLARCGAVSPEAAAALALAARGHSMTSLGIGVTCGSPKQNGRPVAYLALTDGRTVWSKSMMGSAQAVQQLRIEALLEALGLLGLYAGGQRLAGGIPVSEAMGGAQRQPHQRRPGGIAAWLGSLVKRPQRSVAKDETEDGIMAKTNLIQRIARGKLTRNDVIRLCAVALFLCIFIGCMIYIGSVKKESTDNLKLTEDLRSLINTDVNDVPDSIKESYPSAYQTKFAALYEQNADVMGWIKIDGTKVDYPVVQSTDNLYYERRDFTRKDNQHGVPFLDFRVDSRAPSNNTVIYAHNMNDGQMFGELLNYKSLAYYKENPLVKYDSVYRDGVYKIFAVVVCKKDDPDFNYHNYIDMDDDEMTEYVTKIRERSMINTNVDLRTDDELLTLSTCDYTFRSSSGERIARFVVFARKVRDGESAEVNTSLATINTNPVMPQEWFDQLARQQEAERKKQEEALAAAVDTSWLTSSERSELSADEQRTLSASRQEDAALYLTSDERSDSDLDLKIYLISQRKYNFRYFLTGSEQSMALSKRITTSEDRAALADQWLSESEIRAAGGWNRIDALIKERQNAQQGDYAKWLTESELSSLSASQKRTTVANRKAQATAAGLTSSEIASASSWSEIQALIASKQQPTAAQYIQQNPKWLDSGDSGLSYAELQALVASRKKQASDAGVDTSKYNSWAAMQQAISEATAATEQARRAKLITDNPKWLTSADSNLTYNQLLDTIASRKAAAAAAGIDDSKYNSWTAIEKAINDANNAASDQARRTKLIADNPRWLTSADSSLTYDQLTALMSSRQSQAAAAGVDGTQYGSWAEIQAAINAAGSAAAEQARRNKLISDNPKWLTSGDGSLSYDQLVDLMASRKAQASAAGVDISKYSSWAEIKNAIDNPPVTPPVEEPVTPPPVEEPVTPPPVEEPVTPPPVEDPVTPPPVEDPVTPPPVDETKPTEDPAAPESTPTQDDTTQAAGTEGTTT